MPASLNVTTPSIWFIPFTQLKSTARAVWQRDFPDRVMPQITTVREWGASIGAVSKLPTDLQLNVGLDRITAESLLKRSGLSADSPLVQRLLDAAYELAPVVAAIHPSDRLAWAQTKLPLFQTQQFALEGAIGHIAVMWAATCSFDTDILWSKAMSILTSVERVYITEGLQRDLLLQALLDKANVSIDHINMGELSQSKANSIAEYGVDSFEDMVQQTAAIVLGHVQQDLPNSPASIALVALDRQLTRRVSSVLANRGVALVDETGWALSTTVVAAQLMAWLEALARDASSDAVLGALKTAPKRFAANEVSQLEGWIRREGHVQWWQTHSQLLGDWPARFTKSQPLSAWLVSLQGLLEHLGLWADWQQDAAGQNMLEALFLEIPQSDLVPNARLSYVSFVQWVRAVLEASRFRLKWDSDASGTATVTILPLAQTWGRDFDAVIVPSCSEECLPARPRVLGDWSHAQREALSLVTSSDTAAAQSKAWKWLCSLPSVSVLWQRMQGGEQLAKSGLLQLLELQGRLMPCLSPPARTEGSGRAGGLAPLLPDLPDVFKNGVSIDWQTLAPKHISASGYADLRACPYRFYAKQILGLRDSPELDETVEKRDFGTWLHGTLHRFHESLKQDAAQESEALLDRCAAAEQKALGLDDAAFLPFALIWPQTRSAYLAWLVTHGAAGLTYQQGEQKRALALTVEEKKIELVGTIDRIDADSVGNTWLLDYKTESADKTGKRIKEADEDTQLAFYAVLVSGEQSQNQRQVNAAYVNLVERVNNKQGRRGTQTHALPELELRRDALLNGISSDLMKIAAGHGLRALGEGDACAYCTVRGLCRKDFQ